LYDLIASTLTHFTIELPRSADASPTATPAAPAGRGATSLTPRRAEVLGLLRTGPRSAVDLAAALKVTRQAVLKHLNALEALGLVAPIGNRRAKSVRWQTTNPQPR